MVGRDADLICCSSTSSPISEKILLFFRVELLGCSVSAVGHGMMIVHMLEVEQDWLVHYIVLYSLGIA